VKSTRKIFITAKEKKTSKSLQPTLAAARDASSSLVAAIHEYHIRIGSQVSERLHRWMKNKPEKLSGHSDEGTLFTATKIIAMIKFQIPAHGGLKMF
jgi:hypothetical protein